MWRSFRHPNILPLLGVTMSETQLAMASEWMMNGNINKFMKAHADADRLELVSTKFNFRSYLLSDQCSILLAERHCWGRGLPTQPRSVPRRSQGGTSLNSK